MRVEIKSTLLAGGPAPPSTKEQGGKPEVFEAATAVDLVTELKAGSMFTADLSVPDFVRRVQTGLRMQMDIELDLGSDAEATDDEELARRFLSALHVGGLLRLTE